MNSQQNLYHTKVTADFKKIPTSNFHTQNLNYIARILAVTGHIVNGHKGFEKRTNENPMSIYKIILEHYKQLNKQKKITTLKNIQQNIQTEIDNFVKMFYNALDKDKQYIQLKKTRYILGFILQKDIKLDVMEFLRGFYLVSKMDGNLREEVQGMGYGITLPLNFHKFSKENQYTLEDLAKTAYANKDFSDEYIYQELLNKRLINKKAKPIYFNSMDLIPTWDQIIDQYGVELKYEKNKKIIDAYIRQKQGTGISDDIGILITALLDSIRDTDYPNSHEDQIISRILGGITADRLDTIRNLAQYSLFGGIDEVIGDYFNKIFTEKLNSNEFRKAYKIKKNVNSLATTDDLVTLIKLGNIAPRIHSSVRYFAKHIIKDKLISSQYINIINLGYSILNKKQIYPPYTIIPNKIGFHKIRFNNFVDAINEIINRLNKEKLTSLKLKEVNNS